MRAFFISVECFGLKGQCTNSACRNKVLQFLSHLLS